MYVFNPSARREYGLVLSRVIPLKRTSPDTLKAIWLCATYVYSRKWAPYHLKVSKNKQKVQAIGLQGPFV